VKRGRIVAANEDVVDSRQLLLEAEMAQVRREVEVAREDDRLVRLGQLEDVLDRALDLGLGIPGRVRRVQVPEHERLRGGALQPHELADPPLAGADPDDPGLVQREDAPLPGTELGPEQNRVRLPGEKRLEETRVQRCDEPIERRRQPGPAGGVTQDAQTAPSGEAAERPDRDLLEAEDIGTVGARQPNHLLQVRAPGRR
jgi:hypothetical protein